MGKCAEWSRSAEPTPTERLPLSAGEKSLRFPEGKVLIRRDDARNGQG